MFAVGNTIEFFFMALSLGVGIFSFLCRPEETGAGFLKVVHAITGIAALIAFAFHISYASFTSPQAFFYYFVMTCSLLTYFLHKDRKTVFMWVLYAIQNLSLVWLIYLFHNQYFPFFLFFLSSSLFLGIITYAMVLGHWYLVVPKLSEAPLKKAMIILWILLFVKVVSTGMGIHHNHDFFVSGSTDGAGFMFNWVLLSMRVGWGYLVIGIMSYFTWRLVCMRSIQSATGILYAMTFFVLGAEIVSGYLFFEYGMLI